jgi:hypothetical protein
LLFVPLFLFILRFQPIIWKFRIIFCPTITWNKNKILLLLTEKLQSTAVHSLATMMIMTTTITRLKKTQWWEQYSMLHTSWYAFRIYILFFWVKSCRWSPRGWDTQRGEAGQYIAWFYVLQIIK